MLRIRSFQGLIPAPSLVPQVACVPYDVVNTEEAAALAAGNPHTLMNVDRAEIHFTRETDPYSEPVYQKALSEFQRLQASGALVREPEPCVYLYQQTMGAHVQTGVACVCHIDDYEQNIIKKHEKTRKDKEDDRTKLIDTLSADTGPVFLTYRDNSEINRLVNQTLQNDQPSADFVAPDGIRHTVWRIKGGGDFIKAFESVPVSYVADGHHRTASAVRVGKERRARNPHHTGAEDYNWFLTVLFPESQLRILPYNRLVKDLNGHSADELLRAVSAVFRVSAASSPDPEAPGDIRMYLAGAWHKLQWQPAANADPIGRLDVTGLQERLLAPLLGIDDPRTSKRIDFVGGIRGTGELVKRVDSGECAVAFSMFPTTLQQLMDIADADQIMPPKSTWFEPKLRSGLFIHTF
jgi:uncharacterized protein (DUF1015 family)